MIDNRATPFRGYSIQKSDSISITIKTVEDNRASL